MRIRNPVDSAKENPQPANWDMILIIAVRMFEKYPMQLLWVRR